MVIATLEKIRNEVDKFHHDCFGYAKELANRIDVEVKSHALVKGNASDKMQWVVVV